MAHGAPASKAGAHANHWRDGFVLLPVTMAIALVALVALLINHKGAMNLRMASDEVETARARYVAEAGLQHSYWQVMQNTSCGSYSDLPGTPFGDHIYYATVTADIEPAPTTAYSLAVDQDTWLNESSPSNNYGADVQLSTKNGVGDNMRALVRFDLSLIPADAILISATAKLYVNLNDDQGVVNVHRVNADWTEAGATWSNMSGNYDPTVEAFIPPQPTSSAWVEADLTSLVDEWVRGTSPNYGIMLVATSDSVESQYASREWALATSHAWLEVVVADRTDTVRIAISATGTLANGVTQTLSRADLSTYGPFTTVTLQPGSAGEDTYLLYERPDDNRGSDPDLITESESTGKGPVHSLIRFDLSSFPTGTIVTAAQLDLYLHTNSGSQTDVVEGHRVTRDWIEGPGGTNNGASWNTVDGTTAWTNPGGDYEAAVAGFFVASGTGWKSMDLTALVQAWLDGTRPNYGVALLSPPAGGNNEKRYHSSDHSDSTLRPKLTITYACECGVDCGTVSPPPPPVTTITLPPVQDTMVEYQSTTAYGQDGSIFLGLGPTEYRGLLEFDLSSIPGATTISSAVLRLYNWDDGHPNLGPMTVAAHRVTETWTDHWGGSNGANWYDREKQGGATTPWSTAGVTYDAGWSVETSFDSAGSPQWVEWDLTPLAQEWLDSVSPNHGVVLAVSPGSGFGNFRSVDFSDSTFHPQLVVSY